MTPVRNPAVRAAACMALLFAASFARDTGAQGYPSKPIRYLLPTSGQTEANGRLVASGLSDGLGQQFYGGVRSGKTPRA